MADTPTSSDDAPSGGAAPRGGLMPRLLADATMPSFLSLSMSDRPGAPAFLGQVFTLASADGGAASVACTDTIVRSMPR